MGVESQKLLLKDQRIVVIDVKHHPLGMSSLVVLSIRISLRTCSLTIEFI